MYPHRIRLHGPWECEPVCRWPASQDALPAPVRLRIPCRWREALGEFAGTVRFRRRFGLPRTIDPDERLWLTFAGIAGTARFRLNGHELPPAAEIEVTHLLQPRNELVVEVTAPDGEGGIWGEVALEIRCTAYLQGVRCALVTAEDSQRWHVTGTVAGTADRALDLYVLAEGRTLHYAPVQAGAAFAVTTPAVAAVGSSPRVELVNGAVVWDAVEGAPRE